MAEAWENIDARRKNSKKRGKKNKKSEISKKPTKLGD